MSGLHTERRNIQIDVRNLDSKSCSDSDTSRDSSLSSESSVNYDRINTMNDTRSINSVSIELRSTSGEFGENLNISDDEGIIIIKY